MKGAQTRSQAHSVLWIDDQCEDAAVLLLKLEGFIVDVATTAEAGVSMACAGRYDGIVLDKCLPDGSGIVPTRPPALPIDLTRAVARLVPAYGGLAAGELAQQVSTSVQSDGTFRVTGVTPGRYRLVAVAEGSWNLQSALVDGRDTLDFPVEIKAGQDLGDATITFTDRRTELSGSVSSDGDRLAAPPTVVLFAADRQFWTPSSRRVLSARVSTDGRYTFPDVPPGEYLIAAIVVSDPDRLGDPTFLEQLEPHTTPVSLVEGEQKVQALKVSTTRLVAK